MTRKYPLDPLKRARTERVDQHARALGDAVRTLDAARSLAEQREREKLELERADQAAASRERALLDQGDLTVADLARGAAWSVGAEMKRAQAERSVDGARADEARARLETDQKRAGLASSQADAEVVEKNHRDWQKKQRDEAIAKEEETAEEVHLAGRRGRGPS